MRLATHIAGGVAAASSALHILPPPIGAYCAIGIILGSVSPDVDFPRGNPVLSTTRRFSRPLKKSVVGRAILSLMFFLLTVSKIYGYILKALVILLGLQHRGALHNPLVAIAISALGAFFFILVPESMLLLGLGVGWMTHILLDSCTPHGIRFFGRRIRGPIVTGSLVDTAISLLLLASAVVIWAQPWK